jgi:hypothetical protein
MLLRPDPISPALMGDPLLYFRVPASSSRLLVVEEIGEELDDKRQAWGRD